MWTGIIATLMPLLVGCGPLPASFSHGSQSGDEPFPETLYIGLTGTDHRWRVDYASGNGPTIGDLLQSGGNLHVPVDTNVVLILKSTDFIYTLAIPEFGLKEIAVPTLEFRLAFRASAPGRFEIIGDELCGGVGPRSNQPGQLVVEPRNQFRHRYIEQNR